MKKHNFSAGPSILPQEVFEKASQVILNFNNTHLSLLEISHRSKDFIEVMEHAKSLVRELLAVPDNYEILFLQGGASIQFLMSAYNLLSENGTAGYIDTGTWSSKALKEASLLGKTTIIASSKENGYKTIPKNFTIPSDLDYIHCTSNNTIFGTQIKKFPETFETPLVCDMSSDIFSRKIDVSKFGVIYAGAQKNLGPAGATLVIVDKSILGKTNRKIPSMLDYNIHISKESMFNTPPVFAVYTSMLTLEWLKNLGGIEAIEKINTEKASILYNEIDRNEFFAGYANKEDRSLMNATFNLTDESLAAEFDKIWNEKGISGLKGHRSVGGYRASIYNAMPIDGVKVLIEAMQEFEQQQKNK